MSNREILFKYWYSDGKSKFSQEFDLDQIANQDHWDVLCDSPLLRDYKIVARSQYTGRCDKNGKKIFFGDKLNVFYTSADGVHIHDCIYIAVKGWLGDLQFRFEKLLWESNGYNQLPISIELCLGYKTLDIRSKDGMNKLCVPDSWGSNTILKNSWKENDESFYIEIIGSVHTGVDDE